MDQTVEFIAAPSVAAALLASLEYVNVDMGILGGADAGADAALLLSPRRTDAVPPARARRRPHATTLVVVFATETETRPRATLRVRLALRGGSSFLSHGHGLTSRRRKRRPGLAGLDVGFLRLRVLGVAQLASLDARARRDVRDAGIFSRVRARRGPGVSRGKRSEGSAAAGAAARGERDDSESSVTLLRSRA